MNRVINVSNKASTNVLHDTMKMITNMNDNMASGIVLVLIILLVICILIYYIYMKNLLSRECSTMNKMYSNVNGYVKSVNPNDPNCQYTLKDYYVKTAYNCCSGGSYKNDYVSTCVLKDLLKQGVRGLDFEIYSINDQPVVATSTQNSYYVKETYNYVAFGDVMTIISNYAFSGSTCPNPKDPLLFHLRIQSANPAMYANLANLFKSYESLFLGPSTSYENNGHNIGNMTLSDLSKKIILIVEKPANATGSSILDNKAFMEYVNMVSNSIFMRALTYYNLQNTPDLVELQNYNKKNMTIVLPDVGTNPANPNPIIGSEAGCQMVAMRYQQYDSSLQASILQFDRVGYAFSLKPERLRYVPTTISAPPAQNPALSYQTRTVSSDYYNFNM
jgi:hypothetical protein